MIVTTHAQWWWSVTFTRWIDHQTVHHRNLLRRTWKRAWTWKPVLAEHRQEFSFVCQLLVRTSMVKYMHCCVLYAFQFCTTLAYQCDVPLSRYAAQDQNDFKKKRELNHDRKNLGLWRFPSRNPRCRLPCLRAAHGHKYSLPFSRGQRPDVMLSSFFGQTKIEMKRLV